MKFMYESARLPNNQKLLADIDSASVRLFNKLKGFDVKNLKISDYNKNYFGNKLVFLSHSLQLYSYILAWSLNKFRIPFKQFVFLDYGAGSGMLCLLAKELGIGTVIYNDIYDISVYDAKMIAKSIGNEADYYVQGDVDDTLKFLRKNNLNCQAVASYDVIEHIYNIESFFAKLGLFSVGPLAVVMASGANTLNPRARRRLTKAHFKAEHQDRVKKYGYKKRDCFKAYLGVRKKMIEQYLNRRQKKLSRSKIGHLARNTRGMIESDIIKSVNQYLVSGELSKPNHPTNTCDPYTGNWAERLLDPHYLAGLLSDNGFKVKILSGYYGRLRNRNIAERLLARLLNMAIYLFPKQGISIAPFYTIYGRRN